MILNSGQREALDTILEGWGRKEREIRLAGPAGTGKTTLIRALCNRLDGQSYEVVTPTNKAASVLTKKGVPATTLYAKFFTSSQELNPLPTEAEIAAMRAAGSSDEEIQRAIRHAKEDRKKLVFHPNDELNGELSSGKVRWADTIILDEASMVQAWVLKHLRRMCTTLILVGDQHQLPPVNDKVQPDGYFVTRNATVELSEVMRQAGDSPILELASEIREGRFPEGLVRALGPRDTFQAWIRGRPDRKIIAFTNAHRRTINAEVRRINGLPGVVPRIGEALICNSNVDATLLNGTEVRVLGFNWQWEANEKTKEVLGAPTAELIYSTESGDMGTVQVHMGKFIEDLDPSMYAGWSLDKTVAVSRDAEEGVSFSYGYCITAHKAQGSEWDEVCVIDERFVLGKVDPTGTSARRWIYTAITRAAKHLVFADFRWIKPSANRRAA